MDPPKQSNNNLILERTKQVPEQYNRTHGGGGGGPWVHGDPSGPTDCDTVRQMNYIFRCDSNDSNTTFPILRSSCAPCSFLIELGPVVQNIVSLTSSLSGQLVKSFTTL